MVGSFNNNRNHYRCTYAAEYANTNAIAHPRSLYIREDKIVELIDPWIARAFRPANLQATLQAIAEAQHNETEQQRIAAAREKITICQTKLDRYRAALEAGTDPTLVQQWTTQIQAEKATAEAELRQLTGRRTMTTNEINTVVKALSGIASILHTADPADKAEVYQQLGLKLTYKPGLRIIEAEANPNGSCTSLCPRGYLAWARQAPPTPGDTMTTLANRPNTALLVIDVQNGVVGKAYDRDAVVANIAALIDKARAADVDVVWVQHNSDGLPRDSENWRYVAELVRRDSEPLVQKAYPDSFEETDLESVLAARGIGRLFVTGAQTDECIRSTLHGAIVRGYDATLVGDAHTTEDLSSYGAPTPDKVIAHTNLYWQYHAAPGRTTGTVSTAEVDFATVPRA